MTMKRGFGWLVVLLFMVSAPAVAVTTTVAVSINDDATYTVGRDVVVQLEYIGNKLPTEMRLFATGDDDWSEWFDYSDTLDWVLVGDDGVQSIQVEVRYWVESSTDSTAYGAWRVVAGDDSIFLDMTPPVLTFSLTPNANENGWHNAPVSVVFEASDAASGISVSPVDLRINQEGEGHYFVRTAVDKAGNATEITVIVSIDMTPPVLTASVTPDANENGWHNVPVSIGFQANDALSGIATSPSDFVLDNEGEGQSVVRTAVDKAGNATTITVNLSIDRQPPVLKISVTPDPNENGWYNEPVSVEFTPMDNLSGIRSAPGDGTFSGVRSHVTLVPSSTDNAGNVVTLPLILLQIDLKNPLILIDSVLPGVSPDVWTPGPVMVNFTLSDALSGVAAVDYLEGGKVTSSDGRGQVVTAQVTDRAGNTSSISVDDINIDSTLPTTTVLIASSEGASGAEIYGPVLPIDLKAKLDAFGTYDSSDVALGFAFKDALEAPIANLTIYATVNALDADGRIDAIQSYRRCEFAPGGGFYYFVLPAGLVSGQVYEIWFEDPAGGHAFKTQVIAL